MSGDTPAGDGTGSAGTLSPAQIDRLFDLLAAAVAGETPTDEQVSRLLSVLERTVDGTTDPESVDVMLETLDALVVDPDEHGYETVDGVLSVFERALAAASTADPEAVADVSDIAGTALRDPAALDPSDVRRLQAGVEETIRAVTDPAAGGPTVPSSVAERADGHLADAFRVARLAAVVTRRASEYSTESGIRVGSRLAYTAANAESLAAVLTAVRAVVFDELRQAGVDIGDRRETWLETQTTDTETRRPDREALRARGERLISQSTEVGRDESVHPAFASILDQLSTDEARILRLLATEGPQGVIDIYDRQYLPPKSWRVARNLTMLGRDAGCRTKQRTPVYVQNLRRLGLAEISADPVDDLKRYEVIEAQSHVDRAFDRAKRPRTEYKRIQLTDLGVAFCELGFPFEVRVDGEGLAVRDDGETKG